MYVHEYIVFLYGRAGLRSRRGIVVITLFGRTTAMHGAMDTDTIRVRLRPNTYVRIYTNDYASATSKLKSKI